MDKEKSTEQKKKFLFVSDEGLIGDLAWEVTKEGHEVLYYIKEKAQKDVCEGFVNKTDDWQEKKDWADVIIFDDVVFGQTAETLRKQGKLVFGGSVYADKLEMDREFGQEEMKSLGITILPNWNFSDFDAAIDFINKNPGRYVVKPSGHAQGEKELSFVGQEEDGKDIIQVLEHYKKHWSKKIKEFQLQKFVSGVEIAVGAFFNGKEFVKPVFINFEHKKMFPGNIGPSTGEMGTLGFWSDSSIIFEATAAKFKEKLAQSGYVGYFDVNCIVNSKGIYPLEFTSRFGYPTISLQIEGINSKWGDILYNLAKGEPFNINTKKGFQLCVVIAVPPFPFTDPAAFKKYSEEAVVLFKKPVNEGVHLGDVKFVENDWRLAGYSGYALVITDSATTVEDARKQVYNKIANIMIPNMFYRTDIGSGWPTDSDKLLTWGYLH
ncbi:phosphoribosylamine--glycine ligase [Candidatus Woesearchaeota archaeon]|nr:phosphoribosylamine--glycine ligase [Candidatus Woesearchaeota archaeon]